MDNGIEFTKMHGAGNDFVLIDDREGRTPTARSFIAALASPHTGVGCEGVILVQQSATDDFRMRFFNPDGGEAEMCGNGARCVAAFALEIGAAKGRRMAFETIAGRVTAEVLDLSSVKVWMPSPIGLRDGFVNSGVPHRVIQVSDIAAVDVATEGRRVRNSSEFAPGGTNVDFVEYSAPHDATVRTYERGVEAESGSCGTGAVAVAVVGVAQHGMSFPVHVRTAGGFCLIVDGVRGADGSFGGISLTGPVATVFRGRIDRPEDLV